MFNFSGLVVSEKTRTFANESVHLNILITYAPRKSLERSDSVLLFRLLFRACRGGLRMRPLIYLGKCSGAADRGLGRELPSGVVGAKPLPGVWGQSPLLQNTRNKF